MTTEPVVMQANQLHLVGLNARTSNAAEADPATGKIGPMWGRFHHENLANTIPGQTNPGVVFGVYSDYSSDHNGEYTSTIAVETEANATVDDGFSALTIPPATYLVFSGEGPVPQATISLWQEIWQYFEKNSEHQRAFSYDYEVYSAADPFKVDIYIAINV